MNRRLTISSNIMMLYVLLAGIWWSVLLYKKNETVFDIRQTFLITEFEELGLKYHEIVKTDEFNKLRHDRQLQRIMVISEGTVLLITIMAGLLWINRLLIREARFANQQRNFLLSITHELKSPITAIQLGLETIQKRALTREQTEKLAINGLHESERLRNLVENLLLAARMEDNFRPERAEMDISDWLRDLCTRFSQQYRSVNLMTSIPEGITMAADRQAMTSIVTNLLENAVKYSPDPAQINLVLKRNGQSIMLEVSDLGFGIPNKEKRKVFNKFYRIGNEDTRKSKGTGLGLYIVKRLVKLHNGEVMIYDNQPRGTRFVIEFRE